MGTIIQWLWRLGVVVFPTQFEDGHITGPEIGYMVGTILVFLGIEVHKKLTTENPE